MPTPKALLAILAKRRWSATDARTVRDALARSGTTAEAFAAQHGLHPLRLRRLQARAPAPGPTPVHFAEVTVARHDQPIEALAIRLHAEAGGVELRVLDTDRCPPEWIARLALALRETGT